MTEQKLFTVLGFPEPYDVHNRSTIADLYRPKKRCGIYVLHFTNEEYYVGQAVDVTRRYAQHYQTFDDIRLISFKVVRREKLNQEEKRVIETLEKEGALLRNIVFTSITLGESAFDEIMSPDDQESWLEDPTFVDNRSPRPIVPELLSKTERAYNRFKKQPLAKPLKAFLSEYIRLSLPAYKRSEVDYWSISCAPNKDTLIRININWQEVLFIIMYDDRPQVYFFMARSPFDNLPFGPRLKFRFRHFLSWMFKLRRIPGGQDQIRIDVPLDKALIFMSEPYVLNAIRQFNLRLMRKGKTNFSRSHCIHLANQLIRD